MGIQMFASQNESQFKSTYEFGIEIPILYIKVMGYFGSRIFVIN